MVAIGHLIVEGSPVVGRASADWHDGTLHWPVAVNLARRRLREALDCDEHHARAGMAWYNALSHAERRHWHEVAGSAVPPDAWRAFSTTRSGG
jgi:hypothetical protein